MVANISQTADVLNERVASADILKAVSIFAVVYIHGSSIIGFSPSYDESIKPALRFCVPIFVFLWAYFAEKSIKKRNDEGLYLKNRFYKLVIPFVFWSTLYFLITADYNGF